MALNIDIKREVSSKLAQWNKEAAMHFCRLAALDGARFENIVYPTGLKMVRVSHWQLAEAAEVPLRQAKELRRAGFKILA